MAKALRTQALAWLVAAAALAPASANAQAAAGAASMTWAKTDAILGGTPSALEAILAQQHGLQAPRRAMLQPASRSFPPPVATARTGTPAISPAAPSGRPDVFGSVALRVRESRLSGRWRKVEQARLSGAPARYAETLTRLEAVDRLDAVNRYVNRRVRFVEDQRQYGRADVWAAAADTLSRGKGDCEDYAIAKLQMLRRAGLADRDLYLVIVKDLVSRSDHAVLVVRAEQQMYVLDNGTDRLLPSEQIRDYRPILTFAASGTWTHGYRVAAAPVELASAEPQRSRSASLLALSTGFNK